MMVCPFKPLPCPLLCPLLWPLACKIVLYHPKRFVYGCSQLKTWPLPLFTPLSRSAGAVPCLACCCSSTSFILSNIKPSDGLKNIYKNFGKIIGFGWLGIGSNILFVTTLEFLSLSTCLAIFLVNFWLACFYYFK